MFQSSECECVDHSACNRTWGEETEEKAEESRKERSGEEKGEERRGGECVGGFGSDWWEKLGKGPDFYQELPQVLEGIELRVLGFCLYTHTLDESCLLAKGIFFVSFVFLACIGRKMSDALALNKIVKGR